MSLQAIAVTKPGVFCRFYPCKNRYDELDLIKKQLFTRDSFDRLVKVTDDKLTWQATYNALGRQVHTKAIKDDLNYAVNKHYDPQIVG